MADIAKVLDERQATHGDFEDSAETVQCLKHIMRQSPNWGRLSSTQREALEMIQHKIGRILHGDHRLLDSARDIVGYAQLMYDSLELKDGTTDVHTHKVVQVDSEWVLS